MPRLRNMSICRGLLYLAVGLAICELFILNCTIMYAYVTVRDEISGFFDSKENNFVDKLMDIPSIRSLVYEGKGGGFLELIQQTIGRVYIVTEKNGVSNDIGTLSRFDNSGISYLSFDVSSEGEVLYLIRRMKQRGGALFKKYQQLIVDIGANDGLMSSNSFNLIQLGWDAILVEPQISLLHLAKQNIDRFADPYNQGKQKVHLVNAVIGERDGMEDFVLTSKDMESHLVKQGSSQQSNHGLMVSVQSLTVRTFVAKYNVPKHFAILSIDAEGVGDLVLHQWIDEGLRPAYIVYEALHNAEPLATTAQYLETNGYKFLIKIGWNFIFEHVDNESL